MHEPPQHPRLHRRSLLEAGAIGLLGLGAHHVESLRAMAAGPTAGGGAGAPRVQSVIFVFLSGGLAQHDSFDMKPEAPPEVRGEFAPIATQTPGIQICEHLPLLARRTHFWSMCRSLTHRERAHGPGTNCMLTGRTELPPGTPGGCGAPPAPTDWPGISSLVTHAVPGRNNLPPALIISPAGHHTLGPRPGQFGGRMGAKWDPWMVQPAAFCKGYGACPHCFGFQLAADGADNPVPNEHSNFPVFQAPSLTIPADLSPVRFGRRVELLAGIDRQRQLLDQEADTANFDKYRQRALSLITGDKTRSALFDVTQADAAEQDRYGRNLFGWTLLLSRRLVEAGIPLVQATLGHNGAWDTHRGNFFLLKEYLLPFFDRALSALLDDLHQRGLLEQTLVVVAGEFGRTPGIIRHEQGKSLPGRDHWSAVQTIVLAGGGVQGGRVIGSSDSLGGVPASDAQTPENFGATIYHALGIPRTAAWYEKDDAEAKSRPQPIYYGDPIPGLT